ncbi:hypothetical protein N7532_004411 [Penicillium argentinense]|uniref:Uncharacterized protein n=1 Tax=Penicillium argentinense TaxID=1131581 RepID=A0A9W9FPX0_9EURO|nr:uncharacterized protein N7532_004411 [Penicillium argentinense]KAJ5103882.1 hypothetical protein N7532_004411 [Penicillium argentinense]
MAGELHQADRWIGKGVMHIGPGAHWTGRAWLGAAKSHASSEAQPRRRHDKSHQVPDGHARRRPTLRSSSTRRLDNIMCSSSQSSMNTIRKVQVVVAFCAWPCALATVLKSHKSPESVFQLIVLSFSFLAELGILFAKQTSRKPQAVHPPREILIDTAVGSILLATFIGGMVILANREIREWGYTYRLARGIPEIYSNLACLVLGLLHFHNIGKTMFYRYALPRIKNHLGATYFMCPACARSAHSNAMGDLDWRDSQDQQRTTFMQDLHGIYSDNEVEYRPLLREDRRSEEDKQENGTINIHDRSSHEV